jgi:hypothetical protein
MYVILRRYRVTVFGVLKQEVLHVLCDIVALVIQHATRMRHIVICGLSDSTIVLQIIL